MTRDRELVTDTERNRALIDIIENIKNCNIKLTTGQDSSVRETGKIDNIFNSSRMFLACLYNRKLIFIILYISINYIFK